VTVLQQYSYSDPNLSAKLIVFVPQNQVDHLRLELSKVKGVGFIGNYSHCSFGSKGTGSFLGNENSNPVLGKKNELSFEEEIRLEMVCDKSKLSEIAAVIKRHHPYETPAWEVVALEPLPVRNTGSGRMVTLKERIQLPELITKIKQQLGLSSLRLALPFDVTNQLDVSVKSIALCAGSGASVIKNAKADVYLTGEMSHHDVLAAVEKGIAVILCEHSNTERGFLKYFKPRLEKLFEGQITINISKEDADPLVVV